MTGRFGLARYGYDDVGNGPTGGALSEETPKKQLVYVGRQFSGELIGNDATKVTADEYGHLPP